MPHTCLAHMYEAFGIRRCAVVAAVISSSHCKIHHTHSHAIRPPSRDSPVYSNIYREVYVSTYYQVVAPHRSAARSTHIAFLVGAVVSVFAFCDVRCRKHAKFS